MNLILQEWPNLPCFGMAWIYTWHASGFYGKWSLCKLWITFSYSCVRYHKNTQQLLQNRHTYPTLAQSHSIFYVHKACVMVDHCTQHEQHPLIHLGYIKKPIPNVWYNGHKCYNLAQSQGIFYLYQVPVVVAYCTKYD